MDLSVIIVTYNVRALLRACLRTVLASQTKIHQFWHISRKQDIDRFHIAMNHAGLVRVIQGLDNGAQ